MPINTPDYSESADYNQQLYTVTDIPELEKQGFRISARYSLDSEADMAKWNNIRSASHLQHVAIVDEDKRELVVLER